MNWQSRFEPDERQFKRNMERSYPVQADCEEDDMFSSLMSRLREQDDALSRKS